MRNDCFEFLRCACFAALPSHCYSLHYLRSTLYSLDCISNLSFILSIQSTGDGSLQMNNTQADDEFDPSSTPSGAPAGSTNSSADFDPGFDNEFDSEVNFKRGAGSAGGGEKVQSLLRRLLTMRATTMAGLELLFERCFQRARD